MNETLDPTSLFEDANASGIYVTRLCVQSVLRRVALESLGQNMHIGRRCQADVLTLTHRHVEWAQEHCRQMASCWSDKLRERGFHQAADLIMDTSRQEETLLFLSDDAKESANHEHGAGSQSLQQPCPNSTVDGPETSKSYVTCVARIRSLTKRNLLDPEEEDQQGLLTAANQRLCEFGSQMQTDWPYPWRTIEQNVRLIPDRLYSTCREASVIELVPRAVWAKQQDEEDVAVDQSLTQDARQLILQRRRRRASTHPPSTQKRQKIMRGRSLEDVPRPASTLPESLKLRYQDLRSDDGKALHLHRFLHAETATIVSVDGSLLGPLLSFGHLHYLRQLRVDDSKNVDTYTPRQRRLVQRKAIKERLGSHSFLKDTEATKSKVRHTVDVGGDHWFEFDMGRTMLELGPEGNKKLYWFDSIETTLLDEDEALKLENDESW